MGKLEEILNASKENKSHGEHCWSGPQGVQGVPPIKNAKIRCVVVGNMAYEPLVEGNVYLVYRKHEQTGEPTYSLCTYENGNWIPYGIAETIKKLPWFAGIPVTDEDFWVCANTAFADGEVCNVEFEQPVEDPGKDTGNETVQDFVKRRHAEIEKEKQEQRQKAEKEKMEREMHGEIIPHCMPMNPSPESQAIRKLNRTVDILMEYIQKMQDGVISEPVIEKNWEHIKKLTNDMLDRIGELEEKVKNQQFIPYPYIPVDPISPITPGYPNPNPSVPGYPYPFGPIITYSVPGQGPVCSFTPAPSTEFNITGKK